MGVEAGELARVGEAGSALEVPGIVEAFVFEAPRGGGGEAVDADPGVGHAEDGAGGVGVALWDGPVDLGRTRVDGFSRFFASSLHSMGPTPQAFHSS